MWALSAVYQASLPGCDAGRCVAALGVQDRDQHFEALTGARRAAAMENARGSCPTGMAPSWRRPRHRLHGLLVIPWFAGFGGRHEFSISAGIVLWLGLP